MHRRVLRPSALLNIETSEQMTTDGGTFLPGLTQAFTSVDAENPVKTADFTSACKAILPIFDHLGTPAVACPGSNIPPKGQRFKEATRLHAELMASFLQPGSVFGFAKGELEGKVHPRCGQRCMHPQLH